ncbi:MAG TPA: 4Fe-4S binding protein [Spirochaetota bacterium]|nr:4Fe-4S binding protein [Spirochaetota bacterium]HPC41496.1 4Fe-4S binding protein [Spirochaetota bacterium]HPL15617.1 4Fe-4S binding protein [Spirochaetota bacterium]HQF09136.1 4Fe-4S binding protein [Spirochaetota bacterium]HQH97639.1 4Fe-4S binding protein [Spirochaetota bacterium]
MRQKTVITTRGSIVIEMCGGMECPGIGASGGILFKGLSSLADGLTGGTPAAGGTGHRRPFRISLSLCANGCSRPQIADIGVIGAVQVRIDEACCTGCGACVALCRERAMALEGLEGRVIPAINGRCVFCGECIAACPFDAVLPARTGFRILLGGRLGRRPRLGTELPGFRTEGEITDIVKKAYLLYQSTPPGARLGDIIEERGAGWLDRL